MLGDIFVAHLFLLFRALGFVTSFFRLVFGLVFVHFIKDGRVDTFSVPWLGREVQLPNQVEILRVHFSLHGQVDLFHLSAGGIIGARFLDNLLKDLFSGFLERAWFWIVSAAEVHPLDHLFIKESFPVLTIVFVVVRVPRYIVLEVIFDAIIVAKKLALMCKATKEDVTAIRVVV